MQFIRKKGTIFKMIFILYQLGIVHEQLFLTTLNKGLIRIEAVVQKCSVKRCSQKFHKIHRKTYAPEPLFQ